MIQVAKASEEAHFTHAASLIKGYQDYIRSMRFDECIAGDMGTETGHLNRTYPPHLGGVYLAYHQSNPVGCAAMERQAEGIAEIRRVFVRPEARGLGIGKLLIEKVVLDAAQLGYRVVRLDTFRAVDFAGKIYRALGFTEIPPYNSLPAEKVIFMERVL